MMISQQRTHRNCSLTLLISQATCLLFITADYSPRTLVAEQCGFEGLHIKIQAANANATRRKAGFQCGTGCALKYFLARNEERFFEETFNWGCTSDLGTIAFRRQTYQFNKITTVDPDWTASASPAPDGCDPYNARETVGFTGSYRHTERGNSLGAIDFPKFDYVFLGGGWKDRLNSNAPVNDPWFDQAVDWGWANWTPRPGDPCGGGNFLGPLTIVTSCVVGSGSNTTTREGRDQTLFSAGSEYTTGMLQAKVDSLATARLSGFSNKDPLSANWLSPSGDCARAERSRYRFAVEGAIAGQDYVIRWTEVRRFADGSTAAVERKVSKRAPNNATWYFPSDQGATMPAPTWPAVCPGAGGENSIRFTQVSISPVEYKADATLPDSRTMPGTGTVGVTSSEAGGSCGSCSRSGSMPSDYPGVSFSISLGGGVVDGPGAELYLSEYTPSIELTTPSKLRFSGFTDASTGTGVVTDAATGWITTAFTRQARAMVLPLTVPRRGYKVEIRDPSGASLLSTWTIEDPGSGSPFNRLKITQDGPNGAVRIWTFSGTATADGWELMTDGGFSRHHYSQSTGVQTRTEEIKILASNNIDLLYKSSRVYRLFSWGEALESETLGNGASAKTTTYQYLEAGSMPLPYPATSTQPPIRSVSRWDGSWEHIPSYDSLGRRSGLLRGFDTALSSTPSPLSCFSEDYSYVPQDPADDGTVDPRTPRVIVRHFKGSTLSKTFNIITPSEHREVQCANPAGTLQDTNNLVTNTKHHTNGIATGRLRSIEHPDKTMSFYDYNILPDGSTVDTLQTGEPNALKIAVKNGVKTVTTHGSQGQMKSVVTFYISNETDGVVLSNETYSLHDSQTRPSRLSHLDGTFEEVSYACCGLATQMDREGVQTSYVYDASGRLERTVRNGRTIQNMRDGSGRIYATKSVAGNSELLISGTHFAPDGEVLARTNSFYGVTLYSDAFNSSVGQRTRTTTNPDLGVRIETTFRDGRLKRVTGSAAMGSRFEYGAEDDDLTDSDGSHKLFTLEIKLDNNGADTMEKNKTYHDAFDRVFKVAYPSPANPTIAPHSTAIAQVSRRTFYNSQGQRVRETDPDGVSTMFAYNGKGELQDTVINCDSNTRIDYGGPDRITRVTSNISTRGFVSVTRTVTSEWVDGGDSTQTVSTTEGMLDGRWVWETIWQSGQAVTTARNTIYERASQIRRVIVYSPDNSSETTVFQAGRLQSVVEKDAAQVVIGSTTYRYDPHGRLRYLDDLRNGTTTYAYPSTAESIVTSPIARAGELAQVTRITLDNQGRTVLVTHPDLTTTSTEYDPNGKIRKSYGSRTYPVEYRYDAQGRLKTQWTWRAFGANLADRAQTSWNYDPYRGWLTNKTHSDSKGPSYTYSNAGRLKTRQWARANSQGQPLTSTYTYGFDDPLANNQHGDLVGVSYNDNGATLGSSLTYDRRGRLVNATRAGITTSMTYSEDGQLLSEGSSAGSGNELGMRLNGFTVGHDLDPTLRRQTTWIKRFGTSIHSVAQTYDNASRLQSLAVSPWNIVYHYAPAGSLVDGLTETFNGSTRLTVSKDYDNLNRLRSIASLGGSGLVSARTNRYNAANQRDRITMEDGSRWDYDYDVLGQVKLGKRRWSDNTLVAGQQFEYEFDDVGNRKRVLAGGDAAGAGMRESLYNTDGMRGLLNQYNHRTVPGAMDVMGVANRSAMVNVNGQSVYRKNEYYHKAMSLNNAGQSALLGVQIVAMLNGGSTSQSGVLILPPNTELFLFDEDGNLRSDGLWDYTWDAENHLVRQATKASAPRPKLLTYDYDWRGRRVCKKVWENVTATGSPSSTTFYLYDGWNLVAQLDSSGAVARTYVWGNDLSGSREGAGGVGGLLAMKEANGAWHLFAYDGNGNVTTLIEAATGAVSANYEYGPFGEPLRASGPMSRSNPFRWSTKFTDDETDLVYYGYRYYNPSTGRWLNRDPIGEMGGLNLFGFVGNSPIDSFDPHGLFKSQYHLSITQKAFKNSVLGKKCIDTIAQANVDQDAGAWNNSGPFNDSLNHGDNNLIKPTIDRIKQRLDQMTKNKCLNCQDVNELLKLFGQVAHALQDLYAHSTYVETLGNNAKNPGEMPIWAFWNAKGSANVPKGVITGTYNWWQDNAPSPNHKQLNKDQPDSFRGQQMNKTGLTWFALAEDAATRHTTTAWNDIVSKLSPAQGEMLGNCCKK